MDYLGLIFMCLGGLGVLLVAAAIGWRSPKTGWGKLVLSLTPPIISKELLGSRIRQPDFSTVMPSGEDALRREQAHFFTIEGDMIGVDGRFTLLELQFFDERQELVHEGPDGPLRKFPGWMLEKDRFVVEMPSREGGRPQFYMCEDRTSDPNNPRGFWEYLKGTETDPGPAAKFAQSGQRAEISITVWDREWQLEDIMHREVREDSGKCFVQGVGGELPRIAILLAKAMDDSGEHLVCIDHRSGHGYDAIWLAKVLDPDLVKA